MILPTALPVFVVALLGYLLARAGRPFDDKTITFLVTEIGAPALVFFQLSTASLAPASVGRIAAATAVAILANLVIGVVVLRASGLALRTYLPALAFPNTGNLGLPLALYAAGAEGLSYAIVVFSTMSIANLTAGQAIAAGRAQWATAIRSPILPAVALGLLCNFAALELPTWAVHTLELLSSLTIPLMLLMLGTACARIGVKIAPRTIAMAALRLGLGATAGLVISSLFGFTGALRVVFVLQCAMPVAVYNYVFAQKYGNEPEAVASLVVISTLFSMVTTLGLLAFLIE